MSNYLCRKVHHVPAVLCLLIPITFFITYGWSVGLGHVAPFWPYISDTGTHPPESCIFSQLLNISAVLLSACVYIRYRVVSEYVKLRPSVKISRLCNVIAIVFGFLSCLGLDIVANFQESNVLSVHLIGALVCFVSGTVYFSFQTFFTWRMNYGSRVKFWCRLTICILMVVFTITTIAPLGAAGGYKASDSKKWRAVDKGYAARIVSTVSEWLLSFCFCSYVATFLWEFKDIVVHAPVVQLAEVTSEHKNNHNGRHNESYHGEEPQPLWI